MQLGLAGAAHEAAQTHRNVSLKHTTWVTLSHLWALHHGKIHTSFHNGKVSFRKGVEAHFLKTRVTIL